jgi:shikimate dehydrogenase
MAITSRTKLLLIVGHPVSQSISPQIYNTVFNDMAIDACYLSLDIHPDRFGRFFPGLIDSGLSGNVTAPFKEKACSLVDIPSEGAIMSGACNVFWSKGGMCYGDNTDISGFLGSLPTHIREGIKDSSAIILGAGGAARSITVGLLGEGIGKIRVINRDEDRARDLVRFMMNAFPGHDIQSGNYGMLKDIRGERYSLLVNATSVGWREGEAPPVDPGDISGLSFFFDVVYRGETTLMNRCRSIGVEVMGGLEMLVLQGALSLERWYDIEAPIELMRESALKAIEGIGPGASGF